ncbi:MAG TPA: carboxypeptidase-like regulatory domain-containing protein [Pyrinomonadaceae bacterium]|nr:carboxypeptidase-like regulatory domain-containing protein [Pyrinomonadaceae bacterium]
MRLGAIIVTAFVLVLGVVPGIQAQKPSVPTIQGKLVKSDSKPLAYIELELVQVGMDHVPNDSRFIGVSDTFGKFRFTDVPPGKYTLSINFGDKPTFLSPFETYFYPGTSKREEATEFTIDASTRLTGVVFKLRSALVKNPIAGRITWPDGKPVHGAVVSCRDIEFDVKNSFGSVRSDKNGMFALEAFVGRRYQLGFMLFDRDLPTPFDRGEIIAIAESDEFVLSKTTGILEIKMIRSRDEQRMLDKYVGEF